jgi:hypothetical protein
MNRKQKLASEKSFIARYDPDLQHACMLLGGAAALGRLQRFRRKLTQAETSTTGIRSDVLWLQELFGLENVLDFDRSEAGFFAAIGLDDPIFFKIYIMTDALEALCNELYQRISGCNDSISVAA